MDPKPIRAEKEVEHRCAICREPAMGHAGCETIKMYACGIPDHAMIMNAIGHVWDQIAAENRARKNSTPSTEKAATSEEYEKAKRETEASAADFDTERTNYDADEFAKALEAERSIVSALLANRERDIPDIAIYLGREYQSLEEVLKVRPNWYLARIASMIRPRPAAASDETKKAGDGIEGRKVGTTGATTGTCEPRDGRCEGEGQGASSPRASSPSCCGSQTLIDGGTAPTAEVPHPSSSPAPSPSAEEVEELANVMSDAVWGKDARLLPSDLDQARSALSWFAARSGGKDHAPTPYHTDPPCLVCEEQDRWKVSEAEARALKSRAERAEAEVNREYKERRDAVQRYERAEGLCNEMRAELALLKKNAEPMGGIVGWCWNEEEFSDLRGPYRTKEDALKVGAGRGRILALVSLASKEGKP